MVVSKLGFICSSMMALGLNGCNPAAAKAALMVSEVKAERYAWAKTPAKSFLCTLQSVSPHISQSLSKT